MEIIKTKIDPKKFMADFDDFSDDKPKKKKGKKKKDKDKKKKDKKKEKSSSSFDPYYTPFDDDDDEPKKKKKKKDKDKKKDKKDKKKKSKEPSSGKYVPGSSHITKDIVSSMKSPYMKKAFRDGNTKLDNKEFWID